MTDTRCVYISPYISALDKVSDTEDKNINMYPLIILFLCIYQNQAASVGLTPEIMERQGLSYSELDMGLVKMEIKEMEDIIPQLRTSLNDSNVIMKTLYQEIRKYESTVNVYMEQLKDLTRRVEIMESRGRETMERQGLTYSELDMELVKMEIKEMEDIISQRRTSLNDSNVIMETLYQEIHNISRRVSKLGVYDKNNVQMIKREIADLQKRLKEGQQNNSKPNLPSLTPA